MKRAGVLIAATALVAGPVIYLGQSQGQGPDYVSWIIEEQASKTEYVQVLEGNRLPSDAKGGLSTRLPDNVSINTHTGPEGSGYSIVTREANKTTSVGLGAYAEEHTWVVERPAPVATSTNNL